MVIALVALAVTAFAEVAVRAIAGRLGPPPEWPTSEMDVKGAQLAGLDSVDLLFLGSSASSFGIDPSVVVDSLPGAQSGYNAAVPFGSLEVQRLWYESAISPSVRSRTVFVEISPSVMLYRSKNPLVPDMLKSVGYRRGVGDGFVGLAGSALLRYRPYLRDPVELAGQLAGRQGVEVFDDGQGKRCQPYSFPSELRRLMVEDFEASIGDQDFVALTDLDRLVEGVQADRVIFLVLPLHEDFIDSDPMIRFAWDRSLAAALMLAAEHEIDVIDATGLAWPSDLFSDPLHLNPAGAERLSEFVAVSFDALSSGESARYRDRDYDGRDCGER